MACEKALPSPLVAQVSGSLTISSLLAPVRVVRDRWGVPHIYAQSQDDLFVAQGFVQAQDRLFQMDLWRRSVQGRLSEVLGANFIERDAMTRRIQYAGDLDAEWASYGPDARTIAAAFVRGVNAWVTLARERPPEEFVRAGWKPDFWSPIDLLNRTDAFLASRNAIDEALGAEPRVREVLVDAIRRIGTRPFFAGATAPSPAISVLDHPSPRYLVHLNAPGWNVVGAASPWLPGVAIGHNDRVAWQMSAFDVDTEDIFVETINPSNPRQVVEGGRWTDTTIVTDAIRVKGRPEPFAFERETTPHGVIIASDREHHTAFALRWSGTEPGGAAELAALTLDRARSWTEFRAALARWSMPPRRVTYADQDGNQGFQDAARVPVRHGTEWTGWQALDDLPHAIKPGAQTAATDEPHDRRPVLFAHPLGVSEVARRRFNIGPLESPAAGKDPIHATFDPRDWDRSRAMNAPGQSGSPESAHFSDLARLWATGEELPLTFSDAAVQANTRSTLTLVPQKR
jgi:penicillin G amidase